MFWKGNKEQTSRGGYPIMGRSSWQKKTSLAILKMFKPKKAQEDDQWDDHYVKAYKVFSSDQDGARGVAEPGIDKRAGAYIDNITNRWNHLEIAE
ncbi:hypothetical protein L6452_01768 [Arctium lappa]|uniref:Uncharacterized protein n=1 Tax=Arctium lappa TaxID=4217 RepID=A0ACB9FIL0_ARCLA|nr:hypothetical protein L6452_01768 [Arctium lappa]